MTLSVERPIVLIGAGRMGGALMRGWLEGGLDAAQLFVRDPSPARETAQFVAERGIAFNFEIDDLAQRRPGAVVLAVKPQAMGDIVPLLRPLVAPETVFLSIAAGTSLATLVRLLEREAAIVRSMPNVAASIGRGISVACAGARVSEAQRDLCSGLLEAVGDVAWVGSEDLIDAATAISGSGPAYAFYLVECLAAAGEAVGLEAGLAMRLARATLSGAGEMLHLSDESAAQLRQSVTSPGGTTAAALEVLMSDEGLAPLLKRAVIKARDKARDLSG